MKTRITALCLLFVQAFVGASIFAQNDTDTFFTIWFKNGTSRNFYSGDINSITYSEIDLDGNIHDDYVVQEIDVAGEVERYLLADIEEVSFEKVNLAFDVKAYLAEWEKVHNTVDAYFLNQNQDENFNFSSLTEKLAEIREIPDVADVEIGDNYLAITLNDGSIQRWSDFPEDRFEEDAEFNMPSKHNQKRIVADKGHNPYDIEGKKNVWICNTLANDEDFEKRTKTLSELKDKLENLNFIVYPTETLSDSRGKDCDIILYHGHGYAFGDAHYIATGKRKATDFSNLPDNQPDKRYWIVDQEIQELRYKYADGVLETYNSLNMETSGEIFVNENYLKENLTIKENCAVFLASCSTLANNGTNDNIGKVFVSKGAQACLGYTNTSYAAAVAGTSFIYDLAKDKTIKEAFEAAKSPSITSGWPWGMFNWGMNLIGQLDIIYKDNSVQATCFNHSIISTLKPEYCTIGEEYANLGVQINYFDNLKSMYDNYEIGVLYSTNPDPKFSNSKKMRIVAGEGKIYETTNKLEFEKDLNSATL